MKIFCLEDMPAVDRQQMMEIDRLMEEEYHISLLQMMENAGRNLADLAGYLIGRELNGSSIGILCGGGNNGGGGMAAARHLANRGATVTVSIAADQSKLGPAPKQQLRAISAMEMKVSKIFPQGNFDLVIDALIGYGLKAKPVGIYVEWINRLNAMHCMVLSLDLPSGMDADTGDAPGAVVKADATMTLALPKKGMLNRDADAFIGEFYVADISVPADLLRRIGFSAPNAFQAGPIVKLECENRESITK